MRILVLTMLASLMALPALAQSPFTLKAPSTSPGSPAITSVGQVNPQGMSKVDVMGGSSGATMSPAGPGSIARTLASHFADRINVKDFANVVGDGINDDTGGVQAAYTAAAAACATKPVAIDFPPGRYSISSAWKPAISCAYPIAIVGAGPGMTSIVFNETDGFDIAGVQSAGSLDVRVQGMRVLTSNTSATLAGTAISVTSPTIPGMQVRPLISDVLMGDAAVDQSSGWATGINLNTTVDAVLMNDKVVMPNYAGGLAGSGFQIEGSSSAPADYSISTHIIGSTVDGGFAGVLVGSYVQTVDVTHGAYVGNAFGFRWDGSKSDDVPENAQITSVNFNDLTDDVWLNGVGQNQITGNEMLQLGDQAGWAGIYGYNAGFLTATGNTITGLPNSTAGNSGIVIANTPGSSAALTGNIITGLHGVCMVMSGTTTMVSAAGNVCNGPYITAPYSEATMGADMLGPVSFNSQPTPVRYDGVHFNLLQPMAIVGANGASYLGVDAAGNGVRVIKTGTGSGALSVDGGLSALNIFTANNIITGPAGALVTQDSTGSAGLVEADGAGGLTVASLRSGVSATFGSPPVLTSTLPACGTPTAGHFATVRDASVSDTSANIGTTLTGGGTNYSVVNCTGTNWTIH